MEYQCGTFVEYHSLSVVNGKSRHDLMVRSVQDRDVTKLAPMKGAFGFVFYDVLTATVMHAGRAVQLKSDRTNESHWYYYGEPECLVSEIEGHPHQFRILGRFCASSVSVLLHYGFKASDHIICCCDGQHWERLRENADVLLGPGL